MDITINIEKFECRCSERPEVERELLESLHRKVDCLMADVSALKAAVDGLVAVDAAAAAELSLLATEVAELTAGEVTQEQIDSITQKLTDSANSLKTATEAAQGGGTQEPPAEPPVETPPAEAPVEGEPPAETPPVEEPPAEEPAPPAGEPPVQS